MEKRCWVMHWWACARTCGGKWLSRMRKWTVLTVWPGPTFDYEPLVDLIHQKITPHALHQQRCKNHVQMEALTANYNVGEGCRSNQVNALSYIMQDYNRKATFEVAEIRADEVSTEKKTIDRVEGCKRVHMFTDHCNTFNSGVERSLFMVSNVKYQQILDFISHHTNKISHVDLEAWKKSKGVEKPQKDNKVGAERLWPCYFGGDGRRSQEMLHHKKIWEGNQSGNRMSRDYGFSQRWGRKLKELQTTEHDGEEESPFDWQDE